MKFFLGVVLIASICSCNNAKKNNEKSIEVTESLETNKLSDSIEEKEKNELFINNVKRFLKENSENNSYTGVEIIKFKDEFGDIDIRDNFMLYQYGYKFSQNFEKAIKNSDRKEVKLSCDFNKQQLSFKNINSEESVTYNLHLLDVGLVLLDTNSEKIEPNSINGKSDGFVGLIFSKKSKFQFALGLDIGAVVMQRAQEFDKNFNAEKGIIKDLIMSRK